MENQEEFEFVELKRCAGCKEEKPIKMFDRRRKGKPARRHKCRLCRNAEWVEQYSTNDKFREYNLKRTQASRAKNSHYIHEYKLKHPCIQCGETDPVVLEFDHRDRDTKCFSVSYAASHKTFRVLKEEMDKCDVLCANCHRRKTAKQLGYYSYRTLHENKAEVVE